MTFFKKNKKKNLFVFFLLLFIVGGVLFFIGNDAALAQEASGAPEGDSSWIGDKVTILFKAIFYGVFVAFGYLTSLAVTIFGWAVKPEFISGNTGFLNRAAIYDLWKFIRDFFNLFFIIVLLYTAFTIVFQVAKDYKKALLNLVIMALLVNFSFPISRFIIDTANVPMYFFINQAMPSNKGEEAFGTILSASKIQDILIPGYSSGNGWDYVKQDSVYFSYLIIAIIFMFLFSISLLVLAVMLVVRLIALVILVIFSSVGFAATIMPGFDKYAKMWWDNLLKYAFFGPAAMLMMLIAVRFLGAMREDATYSNIKSVALNNASSADYIASMALFSIPIILIWFSIGLAQQFSIAGASMVTGRGKQYGKWLAKKTYNNPLTNNAWTRGTASGLKERAESNKYVKWVMPKTYSDLSKKKEEQYKGYASGGATGKARVIENQHNKKVAEKEKGMDELRISESQMKQMIDPANSGKYSAAEKEAAVNLLNKKEKFGNAGELHNAVEAIKAANKNESAQKEKITELLKKVKGDGLDGMSVAQYDNIANLGPEMKKELDKKLKKEGKTNVLVEVEMRTPGANRAQIVGDMLKGMKTEDVAKQDLFKAGSPNKAEADAWLSYVRTQNPERYQKIKADLP